MKIKSKYKSYLLLSLKLKSYNGFKILWRIRPSTSSVFFYVLLLKLFTWISKIGFSLLQFTLLTLKTNMSTSQQRYSNDCSNKLLYLISKKKTTNTQHYRTFIIWINISEQDVKHINFYCYWYNVKRLSATTIRAR